MRRLLAAVHLEPTDADGPEDAVVDIGALQGLVVPPVGATRFAIESGEGWRDGDVVGMTIAGDHVVDRPHTAIRVEARQPASSGQVILNALHAALRRTRLFPLHAAAVVSPEARGLLVVGGSGRGKSTLTIRLAASGWSWVSDDQVALEARGDSTVVHALRRWFRLDPDPRLAFPPGSVRSRPGSRRLIVEPERAFPGRTPTAHTMVAAIVLPVFAAGPSALVRVSSSEAMARMLSWSPWALHDAPRNARLHVDALRLLVRDAPAWELRAGPDLRDEPGRAAELLERAFAS